MGNKIKAIQMSRINYAKILFENTAATTISRVGYEIGHEKMDPVGMPAHTIKFNTKEVSNKYRKTKLVTITEDPIELARRYSDGHVGILNIVENGYMSDVMKRSNIYYSLKTMDRIESGKVYVTKSALFILDKNINLYKEFFSAKVVTISSVNKSLNVKLLSNAFSGCEVAIINVGEYDGSYDLRDRILSGINHFKGKVGTVILAMDHEGDYEDQFDDEVIAINRVKKPLDRFIEAGSGRRRGKDPVNFMKLEGKKYSFVSASNSTTMNETFEERTPKADGIMKIFNDLELIQFCIPACNSINYDDPIISPKQFTSILSKHSYREALHINIKRISFCIQISINSNGKYNSTKIFDEAGNNVTTSHKRFMMSRNNESKYKYITTRLILCMRTATVLSGREDETFKNLWKAFSGYIRQQIKLSPKRASRYPEEKYLY